MATPKYCEGCGAKLVRKNIVGKFDPNTGEPCAAYVCPKAPKTVKGIFLRDWVRELLGYDTTQHTFINSYGDVDESSYEPF